MREAHSKEAGGWCVRPTPRKKGRWKFPDLRTLWAGGGHRPLKRLGLEATGLAMPSRGIPIPYRGTVPIAAKSAHGLCVRSANGVMVALPRPFEH